MLRNQKHSEKTRKKMSESAKGREPWNKGLKGIIPWNKGKKGLQVAWNKGLKGQGKGRIVSQETRLKIGLKSKGRFFSESARRKMSENNRGAKSRFWLGGITFDPYSINWTDTFKRSIRERDHYTCKICLKQQTEEAFPIHHIDYNKKNSTPDNLITLCQSCHSKTNTNRDYWIHYFTNMQPGQPDQSTATQGG